MARLLKWAVGAAAVAGFLVVFWAFVVYGTTDPCVMAAREAGRQAETLDEGELSVPRYEYGQALGGAVAERVERRARDEFSGSGFRRCIGLLVAIRRDGVLFVVDSLGVPQVLR